MNDNILCLYYSRTGNTKKAMEEVAEALDCECLEIRDKVDRSGTMGYLRCCFDAMHKRTSAVSRPKCQKPRITLEQRPAHTGVPRMTSL